MNMNRDGAFDLVMGRQEAIDSFFFNHSTAKELNFVESFWNEGQGTFCGLSLGDLDGDEWPDIAIAGSEAPTAIWFSQPPMP